MDCKECRKQMVDRVGVNLELDSTLKDHLAGCPKCRTEWETLRGIVETLTLPLSSEIDPDLWDRLPQKVMEEIRTLPQPKTGIARTVRNWLYDIVFPREPVPFPLGFAFSVLLVVGILVYLYGGPIRNDFPRSPSEEAPIPISSVDSLSALLFLELSGDVGWGTYAAFLSPSDLDEYLGAVALRGSFAGSSGGEPEGFILNSFHVRSSESDPVSGNGIERFTEGELEWIYESL